MERSSYIKLAALTETPEAEKSSVSYLHQQMSRFLRKNERILLLYPHEDNAACRILEAAVLECGCVPIWVGDDHRWMTILKKAFTSKSSCIVGSPLTLLGLSKLAQHMGTPLYAKNVMMVGYPTTHWLVDGVRRGLDCMAWGCFDPGPEAVVAGFTCSQLDGVHIREDVFGVDIVDEQDNSLPVGETGTVILYPREDPTLRFAVGDTGRIDPKACSCGCKSPKIIDMDVMKDNPELSDLGEGLLHWSSILDCHIEKTECGLELELVVFPGEKLPKLPTCAKRVVRAFNPEKDEPFDHLGVLKKRYLLSQNH